MFRLSQHSVLLSALAFCAVLQGAAAWSPERVKFIDASREFPNYLFRGPLPLGKDRSFLMDELQSQLRTAAAFENVTLPSGPLYIVDFNLLKLEFQDEAAEKTFFAKNPNAGKFVHYPIFGDIVGPDSVPTSLLKTMATSLSSWQHDDLPKAMEKLAQLLNTNFSRPAVIYIHCEAGMDRTGEVSASYYMRYLNWTFAQALTYDDKCIEGRNITKYSSNSLQWYCYNLKFTTQRSSMDCSMPSQWFPTDCHVRPAGAASGRKFYKNKNHHNAKQLF